VVDEFVLENGSEVPVTSEVEALVNDFPSASDVAALKTLQMQLVNHSDVRGVKTLLKNLKRYLSHTKQVASNWSAIQTSISSIKGERSGNPVGPWNHNTVAKKFFSNLDTPMLRHQCGAFGLNYDSYDEVDDIIDALVEASAV